MQECDFSPLFSRWIGFDKLVSSIFNNYKNKNYPPYNIEKFDDKNYCITVSLSGFSKENLSVLLKGNRLIISGVPVLKKDIKYLHQGFIYREFCISFTLEEYMFVEKAEFNYGFLKVYLERRIPEHLKTKSIQINTLRKEDSIQKIEKISK